MIDIDRDESLRNKFLQTGDLLVKSGIGSNSKRTYIDKSKVKKNKTKNKKNIFKHIFSVIKGIWMASKIIGGIFLILYVLIRTYQHVFL